MIGISWGGFNALQVAAHRPPALGAIVTLCSTDDRYADDVHYMGGCLCPTSSSGRRRCSRGTRWPPDPRDRRRALARHVARAAARGAALRSTTGLAISAATTTGSRARYARTTRASRPRCTRSAAGPTATRTRSRACSPGLPGPRKGLIGPWAHACPHAGPPGPAIGFLQEAVRWCDHWLRGTDNGDHGRADAAGLDARAGASGRGYDGAARPLGGGGRLAVPRRRPAATLALGGDGRLEAGGTVGRLQIVGRQTAGLDAGSWCPYGEVADWPGDQREMDGMSLTFTSDRSPERLEILGYPEATLRLESDRPLALVMCGCARCGPTARPPSSRARSRT